MGAMVVAVWKNEGPNPNVLFYGFIFFFYVFFLKFIYLFIFCSTAATHRSFISPACGTLIEH